MHIIHKSICTLDGNSLLTEASCANLAPGEWPEFVSVVDDRNEGFLFGHPRPEPGGGRVYTSRQGFTLHILND
jgi:hypothetical protein